MRVGLVAGTMLLAIAAAVVVWALTVATFRPPAYVDDRPFCSGAVLLPDGPSGIGLPEKTFPPRCHGGPVPTDVLAPPIVLPLATFVLIAGTGIVVAYRRAVARFGQGR